MLANYIIKNLKFTSHHNNIKYEKNFFLFFHVDGHWVTERPIQVCDIHKLTSLHFSACQCFGYATKKWNIFNTKMLSFYITIFFFYIKHFQFKFFLKIIFFFVSLQVRDIFLIDIPLCDAKDWVMVIWYTKGLLTSFDVYQSKPQM